MKFSDLFKEEDFKTKDSGFATISSDDLFGMSNEDKAAFEEHVRDLTKNQDIIVSIASHVLDHNVTIYWEKRREPRPEA